MKQLIRYILLSIIICGCSDETPTPGQNTLIGFWVPFEVKMPDGRLKEAPFANYSIFGFYAESIKFNTDGTYFPAVWIGTNNYYTYDLDGGKFEYEQTSGRILLSEGQWDMDMSVLKLSHEELWVVEDNWTYKLKRKKYLDK